MNERKNARQRWPLALPMLLTLTACATSSPAPLPVVSKLPTIPSPPAVTEPLPSGAYLAKHCALVASVQQTLKTSEPLSARCAGLGR